MDHLTCNGLYDPPILARWTHLVSFGLIFQPAGYKTGYKDVI
jgi:hypothetical protein